MTDTKQKTCAHIPCRCVVPPGKKYCGETCEDAGSGDVEIACECGHASCPLVSEEENIA